MSARILAWVALACLSTGCEKEAEQKVVEGTAADRGEVLFHDASVAGTSLNAYACSTCHDGVPGEAGALLLPGAPLAGAVDRPSFWGGQELDLLRAANACLYYFMLRDEPWTREDRDAQDIYAYLDALPKDAMASAAAAFTPVYTVAQPPAGDPTKGADIYRRACASCHGDAHNGANRLVARAPALPEQTLSEHPDPTYNDADRRLVFVEKVRHGGLVGYGGQMPPFSAEVLSDQALGDLLAFFGLEAP